MRSFEFALLDWIQGNLRNPVMDLLMPAVTTLGNGGLIWIALAGRRSWPGSHWRSSAAIWC